jgi:hypothetical protein
VFKIYAFQFSDKLAIQFFLNLYKNDFTKKFTNLFYFFVAVAEAVIFTFLPTNCSVKL